MKITSPPALSLLDTLLTHWLPSGTGVMRAMRSHLLPHTPTVYFLTFDEEIVYIGQTGGLKTRIAQHNANPRMAGTAWDSVSWFQPGVPDSSLRLQLEAMLICGFLPIRNRAIMLVKNKKGRFAEVRFGNRTKMGDMIKEAETLNA